MKEILKCLFMICVCISCNYQSKSSRESIIITEMPILVDSSAFKFFKDTLYINFLGGFKNDEIMMMYNSIDTTTISITTDEVLGFAKLNKVPISSIDTLILILKKNNQNFTLEIDTLESNFLGIWFNNKDLEYYFKESPFTYE